MDLAPIMWSVRYLYGKDVEFFYREGVVVMKTGEAITLCDLFARAGVEVWGLGWQNKKGSYAWGFLPPVE